MPLTPEAFHELVEEEGLLVATGLEAATLGLVQRCGQPPVVLYDSDRVIEILQATGCSHQEAEEHFTFNVLGAGAGDDTPAFATLLTEPLEQEEGGR